MIKILKPNDPIGYPIPNKFVRISSDFNHRSYYQRIIKRQAGYGWMCVEEYNGNTRYDE